MCKVQNLSQRKEQIREIYERDIYGIYRSGEEIAWELAEKAEGDSADQGPNSLGSKNSSGREIGGSGGENGRTDEAEGTGYREMELKLSVSAGERKSGFACKVYLPDRASLSEEFRYENGSPVIIAMWDFAQKEYVLKRNIAVITFLPYEIASDSSERKGVFYEVHPYGEDPDSQTGALSAWGWAFSKILDALYDGAGKELGIDPDHNIVTGVSRFGKAAFVAGAMDKRIKITVPACSGAGGTALFRYKSTGKTYDYSSIGETSAYTFGQNEPLGSLQSLDERHWFNDRFLEFASEEELPVEQDMMSSLYAGEDRYLFITASYLAEDWTNPPAMWKNYFLSRAVFEECGEAGHVYFHIHKQGHAIIDEDVELLVEYMEHFLYGKESDTDFAEVPDCIFAQDG